MFPVGHVVDGTYRIERLIGQGGMACVFVVSHVRLPRRFALKVITAPAAQGSDYVRRFRREAEILAELEHPNLVTVNDWNVTPEGRPYLVMELLTGEDLAQRINRLGALPIKVALSIFVQTVEALQVAHAQNIVHRDLKPANIFLCKNGTIPHFVKVLDFGIAKSAQHSGGAVTEQLVLMGTPAYMAPEQAQGNVAVIDARTDQFAIALVLYEMLTGRSAFHRRGETPMLTIYRVISEDPPPLPDERMNRALMRALRKDPAERYPTLAEFVEAVRSCAPEPIELPETTAPFFRERAIAPEHRANAPEPAPASRLPTAPEPAHTGGTPDSFASSPELRPPRGEAPPTHLPSLPQAVISNITQPGAELVAAKPLPRQRSFLVSSISMAAVLLLVGLWLAIGMTKGRKAVVAQVATQVALPAATATSTLMPENKKPVSAAELRLPPPPTLAERADSLAPPENSTSEPVKSTSSTKGGGRPRPPKRPTAIHVEPTLSGVAPKSVAGKLILSCVRTVFGPNPRRVNGLVIQLSRTDFLKVGSLLSPERSLQLEECLSTLPKPDTPPSAVISFAEK